MKNTTKSFIYSIALIAIVSFAIAFTSCNNSNKQNAATETTDSTNHEGAHRYTCPMHPEVVNDKPGKCPKCGMDLVHQDLPQSTNTYFMQFKNEPVAVEAGKSATLTFTPRIKGKETEQVPLDVEHEKKIHLIIVNSDLSFFNHVHPEFNADGSYKVTEKFPAGGNYFLFADYKPSGGDHTVDKIELEVTGKPAAEKKWSADKLSSTVDGYTITLKSETDEFSTNHLSHVGATVSKNGKPVDPNTLENYLGAKAHVVMISLADKQYMHVHPEVEYGAFDLHTTFEKTGVYRAWFQFQADGKVHVADFVINVKDGKAEDGHAHSHGDEEKKDMKGMKM